jgi:hypothetical protein
MSDLPEKVVDEAERLTRLARQAIDEAEARAYLGEREELLAEHGYVARVRDDDGAEVLVCHPDEWVEDGVVQTDRIDDVDRGVERLLSGAADPDDWETVAAANDELVERVAADHDDVHAENARALADFASNHYAKPIADLTRAELREFAEEYLPRNGWPSDRQLAVVEDSVGIAFEKTDVSCPLE